MVCCVLHVLSVLGGKIWKLHRDLEWCASVWFLLNRDLWPSLLGNLPRSVAARSNSVHLFCDSVPRSKGSNGQSIHNLLNATCRVFLCEVEQLLPCVVTGSSMTNIS